MDIDTTNCDFIDFGYGKGGAYGLALKKFKAKKGVSLDLREESKRLATKLGHNCVLGDVLKCNFKPKSVGFVTIVHFLEHLNNMQDVRKAIALAAGAAKSFLYIEGPAFECDKLLRRYGLKFNWADWLGHPSPVTANDLVEMFREQKLHSYMLFYLDQVHSSADAAIHPTTSPGNQREYKRNRHPPKRKIIFSEPIYKYFVIYGFLRAPSFELKQKLKSIRARAVLFEEGVF